MFKVSVDVAGYNYSVVDFTPEFIEQYKLNSIQVYLIRSGHQLVLDKVTIERVQS